MKQLLPILFFSFITSFCFGQQFDFEYLKGKDYIEFQLDSTVNQDIVLKAVIRNNSGADYVIRWVRSETYLPPSWQTAVCDDNNCYLPFVSTQQVEVPDGDTTVMDVHLYPNKVAGDSAIVDLAFVTSTNPSDTVSMRYRFYQDQLSSLPSEPTTNASIQLYPNPAQTFVKVKAKDATIGRVTIYDLMGRIIQEEKMQRPEAFIDVSTLQKGVYIIRVQDTDGNLITTRRLVKEQA